MNYVYITKRDHPNAKADGRIKRSRLIMSEHLGRPLKDGEQVHHINGKKSDDRLENLIIMTHEKHRSIHWSGDKHPRYRIDRVKICPNCGKEIVFKHGTHFTRDKCCSNKCRSQYYVKEKNPNAKITQEIADKIKTLKGLLSSRKIALVFNISPTHVKRILRGDVWS